MTRRLLIGPAVCIVVALVTILGVRVYRESTGNDAPKIRFGVVELDEAVAAPVGAEVAVAGYVFIDDNTGDLLCAERTNDDPPVCAGTTVTLRQLDQSRLDLVVAEPGAKGYDAWSRSSVVLKVRAARATMTFLDVLPSSP